MGVERSSKFPVNERMIAVVLQSGRVGIYSW